MFTKSVKYTFVSIDGESVFILGYDMSIFKLKGNVHALRAVVSTIVLERLLVFIDRRDVFTVGDAYLVESDDHR